MEVGDIFSIRRRLDAPVGIPYDFISGAIEDPALVQLAASPAIAVSIHRDTMPIPSTKDREGYYGDRHFEYWLSGFNDYLKIKEVCQTVDWSSASLLDFGGATGRVARHFYAQEEISDVMICDVNINNIEWVIEYLPSGFAAFKNSAMPPLPLPDNSCDLITAFSVFTHMNAYELGWLYELRRILKPHGMLYATVHNDDTWRILPSTWVFNNVLAQSEDFLATYQSERELAMRHVFEYSSAAAYNCNTFHPNAYVHRVWGRVLSILDIRPLCHGYQSAVVLQKEPSRVLSARLPMPTTAARAQQSTTVGYATRQEGKPILSQLSEAELLALIPELAELLRRQGTEYWWMKKSVFEAFEAQGFHVTQEHFYSPQPTVANLTPDLWDGPHYLNPACAFDLEGMRALFDELVPFAAELADIPRTGVSGFYWDNYFFPNFDTLIYYGLCRRLRPATVLEVGSGFSTYVALRAAQQNGVTQVCCIEPYPTPTLQAIADRLAPLVVQHVQDVPMETFGALRSGDILFVDTSHVSKLGNDLHHILFHILPALPNGVFIHFHDIFLPYEYPREWVVERNWFWNEQYLLLAFLMYNTAFRIVFMNHHFLRTYPQVVEPALSCLDCGIPQGASLWLRKECP